MALKCPLSHQEQIWLDGGITEFNTGRYWHAHEDWEELWKSLTVREAEQQYIRGIQGLIQTTALMFQYERQKFRGIVKMWSKLTDKLGTPESPLFDNLWCIDIPKVLQDVVPFYIDATTDKPTWSLNPNVVQI